MLEYPEFRMVNNSCIQAALNARLTDGGTLTWTGTGDWTPGTISPMISDPMICVEWMDPRLLSVNIGLLYIFGEILYVINIEGIWTDPQKYCKKPHHRFVNYLYDPQCFCVDLQSGRTSLRGCWHCLDSGRLRYQPILLRLLSLNLYVSKLKNVCFQLAKCS